MESTVYGIFTLVGFVSEISLIRCAHSFDFRYFTNSMKIPYARDIHDSLYLPLPPLSLIYRREANKAYD